jgi:hypothetical protein
MTWPDALAGLDAAVLETYGDAASYTPAGGEAASTTAVITHGVELLDELGQAVIRVTTADIPSRPVASGDRIAVGAPAPLAAVADTPAVYVHPLSVLPIEALGRRGGQALRIRIALVIVAESVVDAGEPLAEARDEIAAALTGWRPDWAAGGLGFVQGEAFGASGTLMYWRDIYEARGFATVPD